MQIIQSKKFVFCLLVFLIIVFASYIFISYIQKRILFSVSEAIISGSVDSNSQNTSTLCYCVDESCIPIMQYNETLENIYIAEYYAGDWVIQAETSMGRFIVLVLREESSLSIFPKLELHAVKVLSHSFSEANLEEWEELFTGEQREGEIKRGDSH